MIVVLALNPPRGPHSSMPSVNVAARGPLMHLYEHPEWGQFLIQAAIRRADELARLNDLENTPRNDTPRNDAEKLAGLPTSRNDADPEEMTGSIGEMPSATMPVEIGETSSTELPVRMPEERPPAIKTPERAKEPRNSRTKAPHRARHVKRAKPPAETSFNIFDAIFGGTQTKQPATAAR
ncbi:MAG: hypothetical protein ABI830_10535 [Pseudolabrys sp.]